MASDGHIFAVAGPTFLTQVDWSNSHHRTCIAASLIQGAYILEYDRQQNQHGTRALAPAWWEFFGFKLAQVLIDDHDLSYFGAIFEFNFPPPPHLYLPQRPPQYVIAFRGTIVKATNRAQDLKLDFHCFTNDLQNSRRVQIGIESTQNVVHNIGPENIWLIGHSLGSSIALLIGREMAKNYEIYLETYLFNSPFISAPIERIKNDKIKFGLRLANSVLTAGLAVAVGGGNSSKGEENDPFIALSSWIPYLFLNPFDPISSEYIGYFEHREKMEENGVGMIGKLATKHSIASIVSGARRKDYEAAHLIPSAYLTINCDPDKDIKEAHGIHQWWRQCFEFKYLFYRYML